MQERGMRLSIFVSPNTILKTPNWLSCRKKGGRASLGTVGFTVVMEREEPSHKGTKGLISDRMVRVGYSD